jgi:hypothetical protein
MSEFPVHVFKDKGKYQRPGGTYSYISVKTAEELEQKLSEGWVKSISEVIDQAKSKTFAAIPVPALEKPVSEAEKPVSEPVLDDSAPPTRQELETKATELGIKFDGRYSDKRIAGLIEEALK